MTDTPEKATAPRSIPIGPHTARLVASMAATLLASLRSMPHDPVDPLAVKKAVDEALAICREVDQHVDRGLSDPA